MNGMHVGTLGLESAFVFRRFMAGLALANWRSRRTHTPIFLLFVGGTGENVEKTEDKVRK